MQARQASSELIQGIPEITSQSECPKNLSHAEIDEIINWWHELSFHSTERALLRKASHPVQYSSLMIVDALRVRLPKWQEPT